MSKPLYQRKDCIGANVKPGHVPGSFSKAACIGKNNSRRARLNPSTDSIKRAAEQTLVRHGVAPFSHEIDCRAQPKKP